MNASTLDFPVSLERLADARRARNRPAGVTRPPALDDPTQFTRIPAVPLGDNPPNFVPIRKIPVLDTYADEGRGEATEAYLDLLVKNTNARVADEEYPVATIGHFVEDAAEPEQPEIVGYFKNFVVGTYKGRPCVLADEYLRVDRYADAVTYPRRSVEMWQSRRPEGNYIEAIAHLRKAPERPLGLITHAKAEDDDRVLVRFCRAAPFEGAAVAAPSSPLPGQNRKRASMPTSSTQDASYQAGFRAGLDRAIAVLRDELRRTGLQQRQDAEDAQVAELEKQVRAQRRAADAAAKRIAEEAADAARRAQAEGQLVQAPSRFSKTTGHPHELPSVETGEALRQLAKEQLSRVERKLEAGSGLGMPCRGDDVLASFAKEEMLTGRRARERERFLSWASSNRLTDLDVAEARWRDLHGARTVLS